MDYEVVVDNIDREDWERYAGNFADYSIYQTWAYGAIRWGEENLSHVIVGKESEIVAAAQVRIILFPLIGSGIAYVARGPMWRGREKETTPKAFRQIIHALYQEYVLKRRLFLRLVPNEFERGNGELQLILKGEGFHRQASVPPYRTILNDLSPPLEELKRSLHKSWRKNLPRSERNNLVVSEGSGDNLYGVFMDLYQEMRARKNFVSGVDVGEFRNIQKDLPDALKMQIFICSYRDEPVAALVWSAIGDTGITILSATGNKGLKLYASYLLRWRLIERLKERNVRFLDQGGVDPELNPGGYIFKAGMGGKEQFHIGAFEACDNWAIRTIWRMSERIYNLIRK